MDYLRVGMYVRCPIDDECPHDPRLFVLGQVFRYDRDKNEVHVNFHDLVGARKFYEELPRRKVYDAEELVRCRALDGSPARVLGDVKSGEILGRAGSTEDGWYTYYVRRQGSPVEVLRERELEISFLHADYSPVGQLVNYEFHNPFWYRRRTVVTNSLHVLKNATYGFETLVGARAFLLPHQVDTIVRAVPHNPCRFMLADEVGLGKTIEAAVIMKGLKERLGKVRTLIIAPSSLVRQWRNELSNKLWLDFPLWNQDRAGKGDLILPLERVATPEGQAILLEKWDLCIVDETHRLLGLSDEYRLLFEFSRRAAHLLLLSATPIQQRRAEYRRLLALLVPDRYGVMSDEAFGDLLEKQAKLRERVHSLVRDLDEYISDGLAEDYVTELERVAHILKDPNFEALVEDIDPSAEDQGLAAVKMALAYIGENYQVERHILRHRRLELKDRMPRRSVETVPYSLAGASLGFYETDVYETLLTYMDEVTSAGGQRTRETTEFMAKVFSAFFSSPWALQAVLGVRERWLKKVARSGDLTREAFVGEKEHLDRVSATTKRWLTSVERELAQPQVLYDDPDLVKGRLGKVYDYLSQTDENAKYVVFSSWTETALQLDAFLRRAFSDSAVAVFCSGMDDLALQAAVDRFQGDPQCRFMVCDSLGGEGRNLQVAEALLHVDLPWSPADLEQRIGRLDRIGREKDVCSVVFYAEETVEEDLFRLWDEGLRVFSESLSGLEIGLGTIQQELFDNLGRDPRYGLRRAVDAIKGQAGQMRSQVEMERYFDVARHLDRRIEDQLTSLIGKFDGLGGRDLETTMLSWTPSVGLKAETERGEVIHFRPETTSLSAMKNALLIPPDLSKAHNRGRRQYLKGTFSRKVAILREDLMFYAPGDELFDSLVRNADICFRGRCCAYAKQADLPRDWRGFVFTWSVRIDPKHLLEAGEGIENLALAGGYAPLDQIVTVEGLSEEDRELDHLIDPLQLNNGFDPKRVAHLGQRGGGSDFLHLRREAGLSNAGWFRREFPQAEWQQLVKDSHKRQLKRIQERLRRLGAVDRADVDFERRLNGLKAAVLYYGRSDRQVEQEQQHLQTVFHALLKGLDKPQVRLDSAAFVWLVTNHD